MIDDYVNAVSRHLHVPRARRDRILHEVQHHLLDSTADLEAQGTAPAAARQQAIASFGPADQLACEFNAQAATSTMRRTPIAVGAGGVMVAGGFLLAAATLPHPAAAAPAGIGTQISFFLAVVAFQCAVVAGARAASLVAARWRASTAPLDDRDVVRHAATICASGLAFASAAWLVTMSTRTADRSLLDEKGAAVGVVLMLTGTLAAAMFSFAHRAAVPESDVPSVPFRSGVIAGSGERVVAFALDHPVSSCVTTAIVAAASAMSHAETTALGALPWGVAEAAAVVAGFVLLGPRLGLRGGLGVVSS